MIDSLITTETYLNDNITISSNSTSNQTFNIAKDGYTPLGVIAVSMENATTSGIGANQVYCFSARISGNTLTAKIKNSSTSASCTIQCEAIVLYKHNL